MTRQASTTIIIESAGNRDEVWRPIRVVVGPMNQALEVVTALDCSNLERNQLKQRGFSILEITVVLFIVLIVAVVAIPNGVQASRNAQLRHSAGAFAGLMQQARIMAAKNNASPGYPIQFTNAQRACIDINGDGACQANEPQVQFSGNVVQTVAAPPAAYVLTGDNGGAYPSTTVLAFSPRGMPCPYVAGPPATCTTPAANYFVYYLTDSWGNWAAVAVARGGRTKVVSWRGTAWY